MKKWPFISILVTGICLLFFSFALYNGKADKPVFKLTSKEREFIAGNPVVISFKVENTPSQETFLILTSSYGTLALNSNADSNNLDFKLPDFYAHKAGHVTWKLVYEEKEAISGVFDIVPNNKTILENYLGPRSMLTGDGHYTMMVAVPTDGFDNPKPEGTPVVIKHQFLQSINQETIPTKDFISWERIYAPEKSGKLLTSVSCNETETKETETDVYPSIPKDFVINYSRNHEYADGNQLTTLTTAVIKDKFGNTVSDGTTVTYHVLNNNQVHLKTIGTTINGIAEAKILSPEHADEYTITAFVNGMAQSNSIHIKYLPVKTNIAYKLSLDKRTVTVGPVTSFMGQLAPDGTTIRLEIYQKDKPVKKLIAYSSRGKANFKLDKKEYPDKEYTIIISVLGNTLKPFKITYDSSK